MSKLSIKGELEKLDKLNKSNPLRYTINASKDKTKFGHIFTPMVWVLSKRVEDVSLQQVLRSRFYSFDAIFLGIVLIEKPQNYVEGICFNI